MKNLLLAICILALGNATLAQALNEPSRLLLLSKYEEAKKEIDKIFTGAKANEDPEALLLKSKIYAEVYFDSLLRTKYPESGDQTHRAIKQYALREPSLKAFRESNGMRAVSIIYSTKFNEGRKLFAASKWNEALQNFTVAEDLGDFISKNGLGRSRQNIDTVTVLYAGYAAQNAQNTERAVFYYKKLAAEKIGGTNFIEVYRYLLNQSLLNKNSTEFNQYLALVRALYPDQLSLWSAYEIEYMSKTGSVTQMLTKYKTDDANGKLSPSDYAAYAEYFNNIPPEEIKKAGTAEKLNVKTLASQAFGKAFEKDRNSLYAFNAGVLLYQQYAELKDQVVALRGTDAEVKAKRAPLERQQRQYADMSAEWLEKAYTVLKAKSKMDTVELSCLSKSVNFLADIYEWKRDQARGKNTEEYNRYDAKYRQFNAETGMYK